LIAPSGWAKLRQQDRMDTKTPSTTHLNDAQRFDGLRLIAPKRRNVGNPWFKRGTLYRAVVDTLPKATGPMTADDICKTLLAGKTPAATRAQENNLQAAILAALRKREGAVVTSEGFPARWRLTSP
jgi:hypothetical protein